MLKRKRAAESSSPGPSSRPAAHNKHLRYQCTSRCEAAKKELTAALKLAAGFERQKQGRRKKTATQKGDTKAVERLDREYGVLKQLDAEKVPKIAEEHIRKTLGRVKSVRDVEGFEGLMPKWVVAETEKRERPAEELNVLARLYKSAPVKKVMDAFVDDIKGIVGVGGAGKNGDTSAHGAREKKSRTEKAEKLAHTAPGREENGDGDMDEYSGCESEEEFNGFDSDIAPASDDEEFDSDVLAAFSTRIAPASSGEESDSDDDSDISYPPSIQSEDSNNPLDSVSSDDAASESESETKALHPKAVKSKLKDSLKPTESTFLPSLSMAAYVSGSESEPSDLDSEFQAPRKNRRGQRARQKIWEQKYGKGAKHLAKQPESAGKVKWDSKRGAVIEGDDRRAGKGRGRGRVTEKSTGANLEPVGERKGASGPVKPRRDDVGDLHPSWAAKKAAKEKSLSAKPMGKKIVFD